MKYKFYQYRYGFMQIVRIKTGEFKCCHYFRKDDNTWYESCCNHLVQPDAFGKITRDEARRQIPSAFGKEVFNKTVRRLTI